MKGIAASPGVAMGRVCIHQDIFSHIRVLPIEDHEIGNEIRRVQKAVEDIEEAIRSDQEMIRKNIGPKEAEIFSAHLSIIEDSHFLLESTWTEEVERGDNQNLRERMKTVE